MPIFNTLEELQAWKKSLMECEVPDCGDRRLFDILTGIVDPDANVPKEDRVYWGGWGPVEFDDDGDDCTPEGSPPPDGDWGPPSPFHGDELQADCKPKSTQPTSRAWRQDLKLYDDVLG